jgi:hypothetical protein
VGRWDLSDCQSLIIWHCAICGVNKVLACHGNHWEDWVNRYIPLILEDGRLRGRESDELNRKATSKSNVTGVLYSVHVGLHVDTGL